MFACALHASSHCFSGGCPVANDARNIFCELNSKDSHGCSHSLHHHFRRSWPSQEGGGLVANVFIADHSKQNGTAGKQPALNSCIAIRVHLQADEPGVGPKAVQVDLTTSLLTAAVGPPFSTSATQARLGLHEALLESLCHGLAH